MAWSDEVIILYSWRQRGHTGTYWEWSGHQIPGLKNTHNVKTWALPTSSHVKIQHQTEENQRMLDETSVMFKAQIDRVKVENETLVNNQRPQIKALEDSVASMTRENVKLRHQIQASIELSRKDLK